MHGQTALDYARIADGELARLCAARDPDAVRHVITANNQRLFRTAWSILREIGRACVGKECRSRWSPYH